MKRKSGRKSAKHEEESSNGVEDIDQNGDAGEDEPQEKKKKSSKGRKSKRERESESESDADDVENQDTNRNKRKNKGKPSKKEERDIEESDDSGDFVKKPKGKSSKKEEKDIEEKEEDGDFVKKGKGKSAKKEEKEIEEDGDEGEDECQYEVEAVLDHKFIKGVRHYLIRWKGYTEESDTWEPEHTLDCSELINEYNKKNKNKDKKKKKEREIKEWDENEDFEVDRILEVHFKRDGKKEFLVSWKGYPASQNSWEPEENMDCKDLIHRFMSKVEQAKTVDTRELRANRKQVQRLRFNMYEGHGRRLSKRNKGKERVQYHDAE